MGPGRLEVVYVAAACDGQLVPAGQVRFGLAGKGLWQQLDDLRDGLPTRKGFVAVRPELFFGRYGAGWIRDGVLLSLSPRRLR